MLQRVYPSTVEQVWELWTTKEGLESWWGPEGFSAKVRKLDFVPGGEFECEVTATEPERVEALQASGLPLTNVAHVTYTEVLPRQRLAYRTVADFGVSPYEVATVVEFRAEGNNVRISVTQDAMHDPGITRMSAIALNQQLNKLGAAIAAITAAKRRED